MSPPAGIVYLVGAGPGAPGLITVRGREVLENAEVVVYDRLVHERLLDLAPRAALRLPVGKRVGQGGATQADIHEVLLDQARTGRRIVRLKGGDPYVFGRGAEEAEFLARHGVAFEVVPGVTAGIGASAFAGLSVTHRDETSAVAFVTGHHDPNNPREVIDWSRLAGFPGTLVVYMGVGRLRVITADLIAAGKPPSTPAAAVQWGSMPRQRTLVSTLGALADAVAAADLTAPAVVVIGDIVRRREPLAWFERLPLFGRRIVVTRPRDEAEHCAPGLEALGAEVLIAPTVEILPVADHAPLDSALARLAEFDWLVFTSGNGVRFFFERLRFLGRDLRALGSLKLAAIGPATAAALRQYHLNADLVPDEYRSESLAAALAERVAGRRVLLARADRGRTILRDELEQIAHVEQVPVYRNADCDALPERVAERLAEGSVDWITLTSPAISERLHALLPDAARGRIGREIRLASISPVTSAAARKLGWDVEVEAQHATWDGLVAELLTLPAVPFREEPDIITPENPG